MGLIHIITFWVRLIFSVSGVYKKSFGCGGGGGELIHILTFWGRLIQFFPLTRVKVDIFQIYSEQF